MKALETPPLQEPTIHLDALELATSVFKRSTVAIPNKPSRIGLVTKSICLIGWEGAGPRVHCGHVLLNEPQSSAGMMCRGPRSSYSLASEDDNYGTDGSIISCVCPAYICTLCLIVQFSKDVRQYLTGCCAFWLSIPLKYMFIWFRTTSRRYTTLMLDIQPQSGLSSHQRLTST